MKLFLKPLSSIITVSSGSSAHTLRNKQTKTPHKKNQKRNESLKFRKTREKENDTLFIDDVIAHTDKTNRIIQLLEFIRGFCEVDRHKINFTKPVSFFYHNDELLENIVKNQDTITINL